MVWINTTYSKWLCSVEITEYWVCRFFYLIYCRHDLSGSLRHMLYLSTTGNWFRDSVGGIILSIKYFWHKGSSYIKPTSIGISLTLIYLSKYIAWFSFFSINLISEKLVDTKCTSEAIIYKDRQYEKKRTKRLNNINTCTTQKLKVEQQRPH